MSQSSLSAVQSQGKQLIHLQPICTHYSFCFSFSVQYSIHYMRYSVLYCKVGFVLDDFIQVLANVSVLSMFKVGLAKLWWYVG